MQGITVENLGASYPLLFPMLIQWPVCCCEQLGYRTLEVVHLVLLMLQQTYCFVLLLFYLVFSAGFFSYYVINSNLYCSYPLVRTSKLASSYQALKTFTGCSHLGRFCSRRCFPSSSWCLPLLRHRWFQVNLSTFFLDC